MDEASVAAMQATQACVRMLRRELQGWLWAGSQDEDKVVALMDTAMSELMRQVDALAPPGTMSNARIVPVILALLFETVGLPDDAVPQSANLN
jgi:hypothetical protein